MLYFNQPKDEDMGHKDNRDTQVYRGIDGILILVTVNGNNCYLITWRFYMKLDLP